MLVYIHSNYDHPDLLRQTPGSTGIWDGIQFTFEEVEACDYIIVINHPKKDIRVKCRKGGRILLIQEPPYERNNYLTSYFSYFDKIICAFDKKYSRHIVHMQGALPWLINKNFDQLNELLPFVEKKKNMVSWITSNSNVNPGHEPRLKFLEIVKKSGLNIDLFGRGINPIDDKFNAVYPYKYTLAIENYSDKDYWTEKISDAYLSWTMPFYYGCKNIEKYFPTDSFIRINIHKPDEAIEIIKHHLKENTYDKNIAAIEEARRRILLNFQFFPFISEILKESTQQTKITKYYIPADPNAQRLITKVKKIITDRW